MRFALPIGFGGSKSKTRVAAFSIPDPFAVIPVRPPNVQTLTGKDGLVQLRLQIEPKGLGKKIARWLRYDYARVVELDEHGACFYRLVDGRTTLGAIATKMAGRFSTQRREMEAMVVLFTKNLMASSFLALVVPEDARTRHNDG